MKNEQDKKIMLDMLNNKFNIEKEIKDQIINNIDIIKLYKHIKDNFDHNEKVQQKLKTYNDFVSLFYEYLTDNNEINYIKLLSGYQEQEQHFYNELSWFNENINEHETTELKKFIKLKKDNDLYKMFNFEYYDIDYLIDDLKYILEWDKDDYNTYTHFCSSYDGQLYLKDLRNFLDFDDLNDELNNLYKQLELKEIDQDELNEEIRHIKCLIVDNITENVKPIYNLIVTDYLGLINFDIKQKLINELEQETCINVLKELINRKNNLIKEISIKNNELKEVNKIGLTSTINLLNDNLNNLNTELKEIVSLINENKSEEL